nr:putative retrotransposon Orf1 [Ipomoea batatas]
MIYKASRTPRPWSSEASSQFIKNVKSISDQYDRGQEEPEATQRHVHLPGNKQESFINYQTKLIGVVLYFEDVVLSTYGLLSRVNQLLLHPDWKHLFAIRECTYASVTYEVLATLTVPRGRFKSLTDKGIQFQAFGTQHMLSINDLAVHMGFYTRQKTWAATFHELLDSHTSFSVQEFWSEITDSGSSYQGSVSSHVEFAKPKYRVVHHVMSHSSTGRMGAATLVNTTDILRLYSMIKGLRIHMGVVIAKLFQAHTSPKVSAIYLGPYLSCLLRGMGYGAELDNETKLAKMDPLHGVRLSKLKFKKVRDSSDEDEEAGERPRPESPPPQWNPGTRAQPTAGWERIRQSDLTDSSSASMQVLPSFLPGRSATVSPVTVVDFVFGGGLMASFSDAIGC